MAYKYDGDAGISLDDAEDLQEQNQLDDDIRKHMADDGQEDLRTIGMQKPVPPRRTSLGVARQTKSEAVSGATAAPIYTGGSDDDDYDEIDDDDYDDNHAANSSQVLDLTGRGISGPSDLSNMADIRRPISNRYSQNGFNETLDTDHPGERGDPEGQEEKRGTCNGQQSHDDVNWDQDVKGGDENDVCDVDRTNWDVFRKYMYESNLYACESLFQVATKVMKVTFVIISFGLILTGLITSKLAVLFATSNLNLYVGFRKNNLCSYVTTECNTTDYISIDCNATDFMSPGCNATDFMSAECNATDFVDAGCNIIDFIIAGCNATDFMGPECDANDYMSGECNITDFFNVGCNATNHTNEECKNVSNTGVECLDGSDVMWGIPVMYDDSGCKNRDVIRWLWCIWMCMCMPYILTFVSSMWTICFTRKRKPAWSALTFVLFVETLHTVGMVMLFFIIMPSIDVFRGLFIMNATALVPSFFKLFIRPWGDSLKEAKIIGDVTAFIFQLAPLVLYVSLTALENEGNHAVYSHYNCSAEYNEPSTAEDVCSSTLDVYGNVSTDVDYEQCGPGIENAGDLTTALVPIALLLISTTWWQNYVDKNLKMKCTRGLCELSKDIKRGQTKIYAAVSFWKIILSFLLMLLLTEFYYDVPIDQLFGKDPTASSSAFHDHQLIDNADGAFENDWLIVFAASAISGVICYYVSVNAIQAKVQKIAYSAAIVVATPITLIFALFGFCGCGTDKSVMAGGMNIDDIYWNCFDGFPNFVELITNRPVVLVGIVWWVGQLIVTRHLWTPKSERLVKAGRIFVQPFYCGLLLEQSFSLNRSRHDKHREKHRQLPLHYEKDPTVIRHKITDDRVLTQEENLEDHDEVNIQDQDKQEINPTMAEDPLYDRPDKSEPMIFICATMWHENEKEMLQMIKSIIRLDRDQCLKRITRNEFDVVLKDFYTFEGHIFFDDAFDKYVPGDPEFKVNRFVKMFIKVIDEAATYVYGVSITLNHPKKIPTPYGGKLVYTLPGGNLLYLHLKDKQKIRNKKRWSQVMYMYYLLGHRLWDRNLPRKVKEVVSYNTYILTLDGDVSFKPNAVHLLVDLMRRNLGIGAVCGRIHPTGNGPLVWYQKFEYAVSHWLQKTTEHVLGCVLCSPGCFSLYRASALMDDNIMKTYAKNAEEAIDYVQCDQGEDRWLCTLLLQRGYSVEYSAAADCLTYAPEGFVEFFNQRRRWIPSTFANILDLLSTGGTTAKRNHNISILFILYQAGLLMSAVLGPATIFMMVVSAFVGVMSLSGIGAFFLVLVPISVYFAVCMLAKSGIQLGFAALLGGLFSMAQMVVLVNLIVTIDSDGLCSPKTWFLLGTGGIFVISALLHPQDFPVLLYGILYFIFIPTTYLLLIIYSLCNMHVISWGTREVVPTKAGEEKLKQCEQELAAKSPNAAPTGIMGIVGGLFGNNTNKGENDDEWTWICGDACRCMCCPRPGMTRREKKIARLKKLIGDLSKQIAKYVTMKQEAGSQPLKNCVSLRTRGRPLSASSVKMRLADYTNPNLLDRSGTQTPPPDYDMDDELVPMMTEQEKCKENFEPEKKIEYSEAKPYWTQDMDSIGKGPVGSLDEKEDEFWKDIIQRYLLPIEPNPEREKKIKKGLLALRNKVVIVFFMINALFITLMQTLQTIPTNISKNGSNKTESCGYHIKFQCTDPISGITGEYYVDPVWFAFMMVFGIFLIVQFLGMLSHRLFSLIQIVSSTVLCRKRNDNSASYLKLTEEITKPQRERSSSDTQSLDSATDDLDSVRPSIPTGADGNELRERSREAPSPDTVTRSQGKYTGHGTIDQLFARRFKEVSQQMNSEQLDIHSPNRAIKRRLTNILSSRPPPVTYDRNYRPRRSRLTRNYNRTCADTMQQVGRKYRTTHTTGRQEQMEQQSQLSNDDMQNEERGPQRKTTEEEEIRALGIGPSIHRGDNLINSQRDPVYLEDIEDLDEAFLV